jgi:DNA-binding transcriptional LysR family regulator
VVRAGSAITRIALAFEAGRDGFWLARWLEAWRRGSRDPCLQSRGANLLRSAHQCRLGWHRGYGPQVNIDSEERRSDEIVAAVADGTADVGIVASTVEVAGLEVLPFRVDRFVLVVAKNHPLSAVEQIAFADTLDFDFVALDRTSALQRFLSEKAERIGRRLRLRVQLRSFDAVCRLVECNVRSASSRRPRPSVTRGPCCRIDRRMGGGKLTICVRRQADLPLYARELVRHLAQPG